MGKASATADADGPGFVPLDEARADAGEIGSPFTDPVLIVPPDEPSAEDPPVPPEWGHWRYIGHRADLVYTAVPVTPKAGDVVGWWGPPGHDGLWEPTEEQPTRMPDNHRPDPSEAEHARLRGDDTN